MMTFGEILSAYNDYANFKTLSDFSKKYGISDEVASAILIVGEAMKDGGAKMTPEVSEAMSIIIGK